MDFYVWNWSKRIIWCISKGLLPRIGAGDVLILHVLHMMDMVPR